MFLGWRSKLLNYEREMSCPPAGRSPRASATTSSSKDPKNAQDTKSDEQSVEHNLLGVAARLELETRPRRRNAGSGGREPRSRNNSTCLDNQSKSSRRPRTEVLRADSFTLVSKGSSPRRSSLLPEDSNISAARRSSILPDGVRRDSLLPEAAIKASFGASASRRGSDLTDKPALISVSRTNSFQADRPAVVNRRNSVLAAAEGRPRRNSYRRLENAGTSRSRKTSERADLGDEEEEERKKRRLHHSPLRHVKRQSTLRLDIDIIYVPQVS